MAMLHGSRADTPANGSAFPDQGGAASVGILEESKKDWTCSQEALSPKTQS